MSNRYPAVSVVIPTYYRTGTLRDALDSVQEQQHRPVETIVVDDSGERFAEPIVDQYDDVSYIGLDKNRGANIARTVGANRATGTYVQFLDDDDRLRPDKLDKQIALLESNPEVGVAYCGQKTTEGKKSLPRPDGQGDVLELALTFELRSCVTSTMLIDADVLSKILPLPDTPGSDDTYIKIELGKRTQFDFVNEPLVMRHDFDDSRGASKGAVAGTKQVLDEYTDLYDQFSSEVRRKARATAYSREARYYLKRKGWSPRSIRVQALACYHGPGIPLNHIGRFVGMLFGKPGTTLVETCYEKWCNRTKNGLSVFQSGKRQT